MADFFQAGTIATLHRLGSRDVRDLQDELIDFSRRAPIALVLPCHVEDLNSAALRGMVETLKSVPYLRQIVVGLDGASAREVRTAKQLFGQLPQEAAILWHDGPGMLKLNAKLTEEGLLPSPPGKGRNLWMCFGYVLATGQAHTVIAQDCDITTYSGDLLARLCYPVAHPNFGFSFCKGYSARFSDRLHGRVMRLLFTPFLRSLQSILGHHPFLRFLDAFRYPLGGEISLETSLIRRISVPSDWGVEIGMLGEVFHVSSPQRICQVDIAERFDHKHRDIHSRTIGRGLGRMARDIVKCVIRSLAAQGVTFCPEFLPTLLSAYLRKSEGAMRCYMADAALNGLRYDQTAEEHAVGVFARSIRRAVQEYLADPLATAMLPSWDLVENRLPAFMESFRFTVRQDND